MTRHVFYSFHYQPDSWRASQVRNIRTVEGNKPAYDNDWETVKKGGDKAIANWIDRQMHGRSCTLILAGNQTANRKWINHEIVQSWNKGMGVAVIDIHGLLNRDGFAAHKGNNPLDYVSFKNGVALSSIAKRYDPLGMDSKAKYRWISNNLEAIVEEAIRIRKAN